MYFLGILNMCVSPDLLVIQQHPLFQITPVFDNNIRLSLSEPIQLYQKQSLDSSAGYMYTLWVQQDITDDDLGTSWALPGDNFGMTL